MAKTKTCKECGTRIKRCHGDKCPRCNVHRRDSRPPQASLPEESGPDRVMNEGLMRLLGVIPPKKQSTRKERKQRK